jgi:Secretion system C-terminal sorting domain
MKKNTFIKGVSLSLLAAVLGTSKIYAQTYTWTGASTDFYTTSNWSSSEGAVLFDNAGFRIVHINSAGSAPVINQFVDWQPGIFDTYGNSLTVNADINIFYNDFLNGTVTVNSGATFTCRNIIRVGREGQGTVEVNGTFRCNNTDTWQGLFIGALTNGNGTVNVNDGGVVDGGYQVEVGTRNNYPTGVLNVNSGGTSWAYWNTVIGPNGTLNVNGGTVNCGQGLVVGDLYVDTPGTEGTVGSVVGTLNINSGTVIVNHNDLTEPYLGLHANAKVMIDGGTLKIMRTGVDFTNDINAHVEAGRIVPAAGKEIVVSYDGVYTTVSAQASAALAESDRAVFTAYPNPLTDVLNISVTGISTDNIMVTVYDVLGKQILVANTGLAGAVNVASLPAGIYMVKAEAATASSVIRIVKQ